MSQGLSDKFFVSGLINAFAGRVPNEEEIRATAEQLAPIFQFRGDLGNAVTQALISIETRMGRGVSIVNTEAFHDEDWLRKRSIDWTYSDAYEMYLASEGWPQQLVQSLSDVCTRITGLLQDPTSEGSWDRRGLVIGHVQSGKTANYLGVVAKAADAGYKFIIVVAGIHNNLRKQTQERVDGGFIGRSRTPDNQWKPLGVGTFSPNYPHPATLTNVYRDFNKNTANNSGWQINDFSKPIILVIKKNVSTLSALHGWLKDLNAQNGQISDVPMLMIDDEADNASINTKNDELNPVRTNKEIRRILGLFAKSCYVGYTATPYANIFINPDAYDKDDLKDLFPEDFIYSLDPPTSYFGPQKVFSDDATSVRFVRAIDDAEPHISIGHKKDDHITSLPPSLIEAINLFVLARTIRILRGQRHKHCSMMVNVSRFVDVQRTVRDLIAVYERRLREAVLANCALPETSSSQNAHMAALQEAFDREYASCGFSWEEVKESLTDAFDGLRLFVINSKTDEALDYRRYEEAGEGLTAIAVGGLSLSRGLTIEGLCVSYMYRNTSMYDTLLQMGRWFGYRPGYEDLCRVYLSRESRDWYVHIADKTEELRRQVREMSRDGLTPKEFGLYVETHPDRLIITAPNKMRHAEEVPFEQSFSGKLLETYIVPRNEEVNRQNENLIKEYWRSGFGKEGLESNKGWWIRDAEVAKVQEFLRRFQTVPGVMNSNRSAAIDYLEELSSLYPYVDVALISLKGDGANDAEYKLGPQRRSSLEEERQKRVRNAWWLKKDRVASRGDERIGLRPDQIEEAVELALAEPLKEGDDPEAEPKKPSDTHYRRVRKKPLLMVHVLGPVGGTEDTVGVGTRVPAFGISFPYGHYRRTVTVMANKVMIQQLRGNLEDDPTDDEDYDE